MSGPSSRERATSAERLLATITETSPAGITVHDVATGAATFANGRWHEITGQPPRESVGDGYFRMMHPDDRPAVLEASRRALRERQGYAIRYRIVRADGEVRWLDAQIGLVLDDEDRPQQMVAITTDVTDSVRDQERLAHLAAHDPLTGLPNRAYVLDRLRSALLREQRAGGRVGVLFCDLDRFKPINDRLGHLAGDRALQIVGERLGAVVRGSDLAGRLGGDEFVVLLDPVADETSAVTVARRILAELERPVLLSGHEARISASIGVAVAQGTTDVDEVVRRADAAMYRAKEVGGRVVVAERAPSG